MSHTIKNLPKGIIEISVEVPPEAIAHDLENAARHLSEENKIDGYRPGKAPYDVVKSRFGEMAIYEHAIERIVRREYVKAVTTDHLHVYGQPSINITTLAPGNPVAFTATVAVLPHLEKMADFRSMKVEEKSIVVEEKQVDDTIKELQKMQTKEIRVNREARSGDKIVVDMDLLDAGVAIEGGQARNHSIYLDEEYYVPGLKQEVLGLKEGDKKSFKLPFPKDHFQKSIAGKDIDFALTMKEIYELQPPALDEEFAKKLGQESIAALRTILRKNMEDDETTKEHQRAEIELLDKLVEKSAFGDIPDIVMNDETDRMIDELKHSLAERGVVFEDYLQNIKKSLQELKLELSGQALKRVKTAILIREIAEHEKIDVSDAEMLEEVQKQMNAYAGDGSAQERVRSEEYQDYLRTTLRNRKVIDLIGQSVVKK